MNKISTCGMILGLFGCPRVIVAQLGRATDPGWRLDVDHRKVILRSGRLRS
jgi:hypothetical protein